MWEKHMFLDSLGSFTFSLLVWSCWCCTLGTPPVLAFFDAGLFLPFLFLAILSLFGNLVQSIGLHKSANINTGGSGPFPVQLQERLPQRRPVVETQKHKHSQSVTGHSSCIFIWLTGVKTKRKIDSCLPNSSKLPNQGCQKVALRKNPLHFPQCTI